MAKVTVKLFGVLRIDTQLAGEQIDIERVSDIFGVLNKRIDEIYAENKAAKPSLERPSPLAFKDAVVFINGERCSRKGKRLADNDEVWLLSPASGG